MLDPDDIYCVIRHCLDNGDVLDSMRRAAGATGQERSAWLDEAAQHMTERICEAC